MMAEWMVYCVATATLLALGAVAAERAARPWPGVSRWIWLGAMAGSLALSALPWAFPARTDPASGTVLRTVMAPLADQMEPIAQEKRSWTVSSKGDAPAAVEPRLDAVLRTGAVGSAALSALALLASWTGLQRRRKEWEPSTVGSTPVLLSDAFGPGVLGIFRPTIVIPRWALALDERSRDLILAHEREHVRAGDQRLLWLCLLAWALAPWNPALWWQLRRLRGAIELDCDARVLRRGTDLRAYAALLIEISRYSARVPTLVTTLSEPIGYLERRIAAMTRRRSKHPWLMGATMVAGSALLALAACETPRPTVSTDAAAPETIVKSVVGVSAWRPRPEFARQVKELIARRHPRVYDRGQRGGEAVWIAVDREDQILATWTGPTFTEGRWEEVREDDRFSGMHLIATLFDVTDRTGRPISIVWMEQMKPWEWGKASPPAEQQPQIRDELKRRRPEVFADGLAPGEAIWVLDGPAKGPEDLLKNLSIWVAPAVPNRQQQWKELHERVSEGMDVMPTAFETTDDSGAQLSVVYGVVFPPEGS